MFTWEEAGLLRQMLLAIFWVMMALFVGAVLYVAARLVNVTAWFAV